MNKQPKIIALLPFKNEAWCLQSYLSTVSKVCDEIIAMDDNSTDEGKQILLNAGVKVFNNGERDVSAWAEYHIRQKLLTLGREAGGTHFVCLDADETFSANLIPKLRKGILKLPPGYKMRLHWLAMWKSLYHYRDDSSPWSKSFKDFVFCDDGKIEYPYAWLHVSRTPGKNTDSNYIRFILGLDYQLTGDLYALIEYQYNGEGTTDKSEYIIISFS